MTTTRERGGALVIGGDYKSLGVVRSLGRRGIPVWVLTDDHVLAGWSRYCRRRIAWPECADAERVAFLTELARDEALDGWTLFPAGEEQAAFIARNRDALAQRYRLAVLAPWETIQQAYDKRLTYRLAETLGIAHPLTRYPRGRDDVARFDGPFPAILKPAIRPTLDRFTVDKAWPAADRASLLERYDEACTVTDPAAIMIQEVIPGLGATQLSYAALCAGGEPVASVVARRTRQWPMDFGRASTFVETIEEPEVEALSEKVLRTINYDGLVELEYKRDPRTGVFKLLDFNARTWGYHTIAPAAGVDFPYLAYRQALGEPVEPQRARPGVRWVRLLTDLPTGWVQIRAGDFTLREYLRTLRSAHVEAVFCRDDPKPGLAEVALLPYLAVKRGF